MFLVNMINNPHECINPGYKKELEQISRAINIIRHEIFIFSSSNTSKSTV